VVTGKGNGAEKISKLIQHRKTGRYGADDLAPTIAFSTA
jgi:hypothetical protein